MTKSRAKKSRRTGRGSILMIVGLFVFSAFIRIGTTTTQALAASSAPEQQAEHVNPEQESPTIQQTTALSRPAMAKLLDMLREREKRVQENENRIAMRAKALEVADEQIRKRLENLQEAEAALRATLKLADGAAEGDLARLTTVYENMKPKEASALFEAMEPGFAAGFLGRMRPDVAASIMAGLSPEVAYTVSVILAGRNASVPKN